MKILMVLMALDIGGAETHVVELSKELARRGHEITVASNGGVFEDELSQAGIRHIRLPLNSRRIKSMYKSYIGLKKLIKDEGFDIVHAHARIPAFICGLLRRRLKFRFITTAHWVFKTGIILNRITNWGERTIAVSDDIKSYLIKNYKIPQNQITVTINGIDTDKFSPADRSDTSSARVVYVSRMDADRSAVAFSLVGLTPRLYERYPNFELVIVGGGDDFDRLSKAAKRCNSKLGKSVIKTVGARTDINKFVATADVFVGVSRAALEAMSAAKPIIIAGNEGYIGLFDEDKLEDGIETNFCCRGLAMPTDEFLYKDLTAALDMTPQMRAEMGRYNRSVILDLYSQKRMADDCEAAYADLLSIDCARPLDIIISGYYGYKNSGDDSLLYAMINNLSRIKPSISITVLSHKPDETKRLYGVRSVHRFNLFRILADMRRAKLLISGGGSLVQDVTSTKSLYYYLFIIRAAKKLGMRVMVYASGIGPISSKNNRKLAGRVLNGVDLITLREPASYDELKSLNVTMPKIYITTDPAFSLEKAGDEIIDGIYDKQGLDKNESYFAVSVRPWKKSAPDFEDSLAALCDYISQKYNMKPLFIPMQQGVDTEANLRIAKKMKCESKILQGSYSVYELLGIIGRTKLVIGMRLHFLIYGAVGSIPVFGLSYDPKVDSMLSYLGQQFKENVESPSLERMKKNVDEIMNNQNDIKASLCNAVVSMREKTNLDTEYAAMLLRN
ncbi:MAG: GDP-mannose-dependent alpha-(1-2)-phosphatidylinositol mannosyltransferase [Firmicutes bacterium ADurb.Bin193]|nr:MAG: GDP-mannose-dependent alpha-(1-2)-phosphatidylinositol mannosyltransferase [Firmicutes bacterium ADurb.Bin193]